MDPLSALLLELFSTITDPDLVRSELLGEFSKRKPSE